MRNPACIGDNLTKSNSMSSEPKYPCTYMIHFFMLREYTIIRTDLSATFRRRVAPACLDMIDHISNDWFCDHLAVLLNDSRTTS